MGIIKNCLICHKEYQTKAYLINTSKYCSAPCQHLGLRLNSCDKMQSLRKSYEKKVVRGEGCWGWTGAINTNGYGHIRLAKGWSMGAHRTSWLLNFGEIPKGIQVLHACDNRLCTNHEHLFLGTQKDNMRDCSNKGRTRATFQKGSIPHNRKLDEDKVKEIKQKLRQNVFMRVLSREYSIDRKVIQDIRDNKIWKHVE